MQLCSSKSLLITLPPSAQVASAEPAVVPQLFANQSFRLSSDDSRQKMWSAQVITQAPKRIEDHIAFQLSRVPSVHTVLVGSIESVIHVWTLIDEWSPVERKRIYSQQRRLIMQFQDETFDFYVVRAARDVNPERLVTGLPVVWQKG